MIVNLPITHHADLTRLVPQRLQGATPYEPKMCKAKVAMWIGVESFPIRTSVTDCVHHRPDQCLPDTLHLRSFWLPEYATDDTAHIVAFTVFNQSDLLSTGPSDR